MRKKKMKKTYSTPEEERKEAILKCLEKREVDACLNCCHFSNCSFYGHSSDEELLTTGEEALAMAIIRAQVEEYGEMYKIGAKNGCNKVLMFLRSERMSLLCLYKFSSDFIINNMNKTLEKEYGPFEEIYNAKVKRCKKHIAELDKQLEPYQESYRRKTMLTEEEQEFLAKTDGVRGLPKKMKDRRQKLLLKIKLKESEKIKARPLYVKRAHWEKVLVE